MNTPASIDEQFRPLVRPWAVLVHAFYEDVWQGIADRLEASGMDFDLYVTVPDPQAFDALTASVAARFSHARILRVPNRGRDVAPFLVAMEAFDLYSYDVVLKLHTKRSTHLGQDGIRWSNDLFRSLCGDAATMQAAVRLFRRVPQIGMIHPEFVKTSIQSELIPNLPWLDRLLPRLHSGVKGLRLEWDFAAGTMFWFRGAAMRPLRDLGLGIEDFEPEQGQINGTLAHALERVFPQIIYRSGQMVLAVNWIASVSDADVANVVTKMAKPAPVARKGFRTPPRRGAARR